MSGGVGGRGLITPSYPIGVVQIGCRRLEDADEVPCNVDLLDPVTVEINGLVYIDFVDELADDRSSELLDFCSAANDFQETVDAFGFGLCG